MRALTREEAQELDARDPLAAFRERFVIEDPQRIYLDGNSLGRLPVRTRERLTELTTQWGCELVSGWEGWIDAPARAGAAIAEVIGAEPHEVVVCDSVTVNLYKLAMAAHRDGPLVAYDDEFPTDRYILEGIATERGQTVRLSRRGQSLLRGGDGLCVLSHAGYRTARLEDLRGTTARARELGVPLIWDLSHSAGAVPIDLNAAGVELAVGCTYKYLNAGPGAPAFLYVAEHLHEELRSPIWGWFGQTDQFAMERPHDPHPSIRRFLAGTPPIMGVVSVEEGAQLVAEAGVAAIREKSVAQTELLIALADAWLPGFEVASPRDAARRGSHVALRHPDAARIERDLIDRANVVPDFRGPDLLRLGIAPLYTRYVDVWDAMDRLRRLD